MADLNSNQTSLQETRPAARRDLFTTIRLVAFAALLTVIALIQYTPNQTLVTLAGLLSFGAFLAAITGSDKTSVMLSFGLVAIGSVLFAVAGVDPLTAVMSFKENAGVLLFMVLVPLVGTVIELGGYTEALGEISRNVRKPAYLYAISLFLAYSIGAVLLNAAIALIWPVMAPIVKRIGKDPADFLASSLPRGYDASLPWTPSSPAMATALVLTGAPWPSIFWPGILLSLVFLAFAVITELGGPLLKQPVHFAPVTQGSRAEAETVEGKLTTRQAWKKVAELAVGLGSFIVAIVLLQTWGWTVFQAMVPCVSVTVLLWGLLIRKPGETWAAARTYFSQKMPGLSSQFLLMTTAGFIGTALRVALKDGIPGVSLTFTPSIWVITFAASFIVWALSAAGIHSIIGMTIVCSIIAPFAHGISPVHLCLTLLLGSSLGFNISPVSATILVTSSCAGRNCVEVGIKKQWKFVLATWVGGSILLSLLGL
ncbi:MAG: hypothetical protein ACOX5M_04510 [Bacillota bacterium]|jgi:hypothetical protein